MMQFIGLLLQGTQSLHSLVCTLKVHSGINNFISDNLKNSAVINQLKILMLLTLSFKPYNNESNELPR